MQVLLRMLPPSSGAASRRQADATPLSAPPALTTAAEAADSLQSLSSVTPSTPLSALETHTIPEAPLHEAPEPLSPLEQPNGDGKQPLDLAIAMQQWAAVQSLVGAGAVAPGCRNPPSQLAAARRTIAEALGLQGNPAGSPAAQYGTNGKPLRAPSLGQGLTAALVSLH